jgi:crotonobetainyl-CoA:carnitine CoA-transferase CaiB-like acyl-CoA transferase
MTKPLAGIQVVDLTHALAGPVCSYQLGLLGARVVKIENPEGGDDFRSFARTTFDAVNPCKQSMTLNLKNPAALPVLQRLVQQADVLLDNFKPGTAEKMGISWERVQGWNTRTIWCSISGFGLTGPWRDLPAVEWSVQAATGLTDAYLAEEADPLDTGLAVLDIGTGQAAATAVLAALLLRAQTGTGQRLDVAMIDVALNLLAGRIANAVPAARMSRPAVGRFRAKDRFIFIMGAHQRWFETLSEVIGPPSLMADRRFADPDSRSQNVRALRRSIEARLALRPASEWETLLTRAGVPAAVVRRADEFAASEHVQHRGVLGNVAVCDRGDAIRAVAPPYQFEGCDLRPCGHVPKLGADTPAVLAELHYSDAQIRELREQRII